MHHDFTEFTSGWLQLQILPERFSAAASDAAHLKPLADLVVGIFTLLEHTPLRAMGVNRMMHHQLQLEDAYKKLGDSVAPKKPWEGLLDGPGLLSQVMYSVRKRKTGLHPERPTPTPA